VRTAHGAINSQGLFLLAILTIASQCSICQCAPYGQ